MGAKCPKHVFISFAVPLELDELTSRKPFDDLSTTTQAFLQAQQGLEGLSLPGVGDAFWLTFGQMDVPEVCVCVPPPFLWRCWKRYCNVYRFSSSLQRPQFFSR